MNDIFNDRIQMETETVFEPGGSIHIYPCGFELGQLILAGGKGKVSQKGRMVTADNGTSHFRPYRSLGAPRYTPLLSTEHGEMKASQCHVVVRLALPLKMDKADMAAALLAEVRLMADAMLTVGPTNPIASAATSPLSPIDPTPQH